MVAKSNFIDGKEFSNVSKKLLKRIKSESDIRVLRGYKGKPCFVFETEKSIELELRPTDNSNYILYKRDYREVLEPNQKFENLNDGLVEFLGCLEEVLMD